VTPTVCCFKWEKPGYRSKFTAEHVLTLQRMVARHYPKPFDFVCCTDDAKGLESIRTIPLWNDYADIPNPHGLRNPSCYRRLKVFAPDAASWLGERIIPIDLDMVVTGDLTPLFDDPADFKIWGQTDFPGKQWFNGSFWSLRAGSRPQVWTQFDPLTSPEKAKAAGARGSDQGWMSYILGSSEQTWNTKDGIYSYRVHVAKNGYRLPEGARLVAFHGRVDPWSEEAQRLKWIRECYR
jgi:hypothetical protein